MNVAFEKLTSEFLTMLSWNDPPVKISSIFNEDHIAFPVLNLYNTSGTSFRRSPSCESKQKKSAMKKIDVSAPRRTRRVLLLVQLTLKVLRGVLTSFLYLGWLFLTRAKDFTEKETATNLPNLLLIVPCQSNVRILQDRDQHLCLCSKRKPPHITSFFPLGFYDPRVTWSVT